MGDFLVDFLYRFFSRGLTEAKLGEFINLKLGKLSIKYYDFKFTKLS